MILLLDVGNTRVKWAWLDYLELAPVGAAAHDAFILQKPFDIALAVAGDFFGIKIVKGFAEIFALAQNSKPA